MKIIIEIIKGIVIGIANIIPGVSGGTLAVVMGIYDKLINAITSIYKHPIKTLKEIWVYIVGIILGIGSSVIGISYLLENFPVPTTSLFIGLIIGAIPLVISNINIKKISKYDIGFFIVMMLIVIGMPLMSLMNTSVGEVSFNPLIMLAIGIISAATMVIPGVSGSMILMTLGYYEKLTDMVSETIKSFLTFNMDVLLPNVLTLIPFAIGMIVGIVLIAKLIKWLLGKFKNTVHWAILGLVVASPFAVIMNLNLVGISVLTIIISIATFVIGCYISNLFSKLKEE